MSINPVLSLKLVRQWSQVLLMLSTLKYLYLQLTYISDHNFCNFPHFPHRGNSKIEMGREMVNVLDFYKSEHVITSREGLVHTVLKVIMSEVATSQKFKIVNVHSTNTIF